MRAGKTDRAGKGKVRGVAVALLFVAAMPLRAATGGEAPKEARCAASTSRT